MSNWTTIIIVIIFLLGFIYAYKPELLQNMVSILKGNKFIGNWRYSGPLGYDIYLTFHDSKTGTIINAMIGTYSFNYEIINETTMRFVGADNSLEDYSYKWMGDDVLVLHYSGYDLPFTKQK